MMTVQQMTMWRWWWCIRCPNRRLAYQYYDNDINNDTDKNTDDDRDDDDIDNDDDNDIDNNSNDDVDYTQLIAHQYHLAKEKITQTKFEKEF